MNDAAQREAERKHRLRCRRLYQLSENENFAELVELLREEAGLIAVNPAGGLNGMIDYLAGKVWQDALQQFQRILEDRIATGKQISGKDDDDLTPGDKPHGEEGHWRSEPGRRSRA